MREEEPRLRPLSVAPTRVDPVARSLSEVIGGPAGAHARPHRWWTPVRVVLALATVVLALTVVHHVPCLDTNWSVDQARYGKGCYSDVPYLYTGRGYAEGNWPYADTAGRYEVSEYPVGISYLAWVVARLTLLDPAGPPLAERRATEPDALWSLPGMTTEVNSYFLLTALVLAGFGLAAAWFVSRTHRHRPWDGLFLVLSPALASTALINWDLMALALVAAALWAWSRDRPLLAGVLIGLGTAAKLYPLFLLGPVLVLAWRRREPALFARAAAGAAAAWLVANLPAWVTGPEQWLVFWRFNADRGADLGSVWLFLDHAGFSFTAGTINTWSWLLFGLACLAVAALGLRARETPRLAQLGLLVVAGFLLVNKVYSPQYVLWLLPLAVLARPRWRDLLVWQAGELLYLVAVWSYLGGWLEQGAGGDSPFYDLAIWVRVAAQLYLVAVVVRDVLRPEHDPVRSQPGSVPVS